MREQVVDEIKAGTFVFAAHFPDYKFIERHEAAVCTCSETYRASSSGAKVDYFLCDGGSASWV